MRLLTGLIPAALLLTSCDLDSRDRRLVAQHARACELVLRVAENKWDSSRTLRGDSPGPWAGSCAYWLAADTNE